MTERADGAFREKPPLQTRIYRSVPFLFAPICTIVPTNRADIEVGVVRVMRMGKNPSVKFAKLFRAPWLKRPFDLGVLLIPLLRLLTGTGKQSATQLTDGSDQPSGLFSSFATFLSNKEKLNRSPLAKGISQTPVGRQKKNRSPLQREFRKTPSADKSKPVPLYKGNFKKFELTNTRFYAKMIKNKHLRRRHGIPFDL